MTIALGQSTTPHNMRIYAIGDVHGHLSLLNSIYQEITADLSSIGNMQYKILFLGDYIDRGPDSAGCVQFLSELLSKDAHVICLKGNHEDKLQKFLSNPIALADSFFGYGGIECTMSYGIDMTNFNFSNEEIIEMCAELNRKIPTAHKQFYNKLAISVSFGDYLFCHAGVRPGVDLNKQADKDLMCIRSEFVYHEAPYDKVIVHGHTPAYPMEILPNRINVDTCAYDTGILSCLVLEGSGYRVITAKNNDHLAF